MVLFSNVCNTRFIFRYAALSTNVKNHKLCLVRQVKHSMLSAIMSCSGNVHKNHYQISLVSSAITAILNEIN